MLLTSVVDADTDAAVVDAVTDTDAVVVADAVDTDLYCCVGCGCLSFCFRP